MEHQKTQPAPIEHDPSVMHLLQNVFVTQKVAYI